MDFPETTKNDAYLAWEIGTSSQFYLNSVTYSRKSENKMSGHQQDPTRRDTEIPIGFPKCPRLFIVPKAMQGPRAGNDLGYFARDGARLCRSPRGNGIFHLAGYWTNEKPFGENDGKMSVGNLTAMPSVQQLQTADTRIWRVDKLGPRLRLSIERTGWLTADSKMTVCEGIDAVAQINVEKVRAISIVTLVAENAI